MPDETSSSPITVTAEIAMISGRTLGRVQAPDPATVPERDIARNVQKAIAQGMRKMATDHAAEIDTHTTAGDFAAAAATVKRGLAEGAYVFGASPALLSALSKIDVGTLDTAGQKTVREVRMAVAQMLRRFDVAASEAEALLTDPTFQFDASERADLQMLIAIADAKAGRVETALAVFKRLLQAPSPLSTEGKAWAWRNIALTLGHSGAEARAAMRASADAFLEAGNKEEACQSLMQLVDSLIGIAPVHALQTIDEILRVIDQQSIRNDELRAATHHVRANRLMAMGQIPEGFENAKCAVALRRGLLGAEESFASSLHLAGVLAEQLGDDAAAAAYRAEADQLAADAHLSHFAFTERVRTLLQSFDLQAAQTLQQEAKAAGEHDVVAAVGVIRATADPGLTDEDRLKLLETTVADLDRSAARGPQKLPAYLALAGQLFRMKAYDRSVSRHKGVLALDPWNVAARDGVIQGLWNLEKWADAAAFVHAQIDLRGELPGLLFALGRSLLAAGEPSQAVTALTKSIAIAPADSPLKAQAQALREEALQDGGTLESAPAPRPPVPSLGIAALEAALAEFAAYVSRDKRMRFWIKDDPKGDYRWIEAPERKAQDLLHTFLKGKFGDQIAVFEEIATGAGRLDLLLQLQKALSVIIELKMVGFGYSAAYASSGTEQILHYLENRGLNLGYLIVLDGRLDTNGAPLLPPRAADRFTVREQLADVRPRVSSRKAKSQTS